MLDLVLRAISNLQLLLSLLLLQRNSLLFLIIQLLLALLFWGFGRWISDSLSILQNNLTLLIICIVVTVNIRHVLTHVDRNLILFKLQAHILLLFIQLLLGILTVIMQMVKVSVVISVLKWLLRRV